MDKKEGLWIGRIEEESNSDNYHSRKSSVDNKVQLYNNHHYTVEIMKLHYKKPSEGTV